MPAAHAILIALSSKRLALLEAEPETLEDVIEARHEESIPGLLDLKTHWELLDMLLSGRGRDGLLGDVFLARTGKNLDVDTAFEQARVLSPQRVAEVAQKLADLPPGLVGERFGQFSEAKAPGKAPNAEQRADLEALFAEVCALYRDAAAAKQSMLAILV